eukprot:4538188-Ditylum_brightwellii.AAC.1
MTKYCVPMILKYTASSKKSIACMTSTITRKLHGLSPSVPSVIDVLHQKDDDIKRSEMSKRRASVQNLLDLAGLTPSPETKKSSE